MIIWESAISPGQEIVFNNKKVTVEENGKVLCTVLYKSSFVQIWSANTNIHIGSVIAGYAYFRGPLVIRLIYSESLSIIYLEVRK